MVNSEDFPRNLHEIANRYGWDARRLNPAVAYLSNRKLVRDIQIIGGGPWIRPFVDATADTRRFVKSRL
jgi:hypothetical protein